MNYLAIWGWDGRWDFYGYAPPESAAQVRRALDGMRISRGAGPLAFYAYATSYPVGGVRWTSPPWFEVRAATGWPPDIRTITWGQYYTEPKAWSVSEGLRRLNMAGLVARVDYYPKTGGFA